MFPLRRLFYRQLMKLKLHPEIYDAVLGTVYRLRLILTPIWLLEFYFTLLRKKPYFGSLFGARQVLGKRVLVMGELIKREIRGKKSFRILEIGSWAGSSAVIWAGVCKRNKKGKVFVIDNWEAAPNSPKIMKDATKNDRIFRLFLHNIKSSGLSEYIIPIRSSSDAVYDILKPAGFDLVYVDGDHSYFQFKKDLLHYMAVVGEKGILCGDDLELQLNEIDLKNARMNAEKDYIFDPKSEKFYHPGIALTLREVFGKVSMKNGFWAMRKIKDKWIEVDFKR
jgi:predicted O-methyltransferase YrrM